AAARRHDVVFEQGRSRKHVLLRLATAEPWPGGQDTAMREAKILLVDDDDDLREVVAMTLATSEREIWQAPNGSDALDVIQQKGMPNLILLDMRMPVMDGRTFVAQFRDRYPTYVPILLLTAAHDARRSVEEVGAA